MPEAISLYTLCLCNLLYITYTLVKNCRKNYMSYYNKSVALGRCSPFLKGKKQKGSRWVYVKERLGLEGANIGVNSGGRALQAAYPVAHVGSNHTELCMHLPPHTHRTLYAPTHPCPPTHT